MEIEPLDIERPSSKFIVGIDLGTTNSAVAYVECGDSAAPAAKIRIFEIPQLVAPGQVASMAVLPSFLYLPGPYELPAGALSLPWAVDRNFAVGELAREQGALVPGRLVSSAKSWLCHAGVDRKGRILPWGGDESEVSKVSPVEASARYLGHIREAWNHTFAGSSPENRLENQRIVLTVPASFDEVARELTVAAAKEAGLSRVTLLEEPLAGFYAWLSRHEKEWESRLKPGDLVLVCDVGGGTTDFTVIAVRPGEMGLKLERLAVGDHLMLGGDNMDLALGRYLEARMLGGKGRLETKRWHELCHCCRHAKEVLLSAERKESAVDVALVGSGGRLIAGTLKSRLEVREAEEIILDGFFPRVGLDEPLRGTQRSGLAEFGLPYAQDPAVTRHLAAFWRGHRALLEKETGRTDPRPDFVLFNGGALIPEQIRERVRSVVGEWFAREGGRRWMPEELGNPRPDLAVAVGAAYYGMVRSGRGVRVGAGSPRSYYLEVAGEEPGQNGRERARAVCLVPRGTEEGFDAALDRPAFDVLTNRPVAFQVLHSSTRLGDRLGDLVWLREDEAIRLPPVRTVLRYGKKNEALPLPVRIGVKLTEVGTLELWCRSRKTPHLWQLQFDVRRSSGEEDPIHQTRGSETVDQSVLERASEKIRRVFGDGSGGSPQSLPRELAEALEQGRESWPTFAVRKMADVLLECMQGRLASAEHEARWLNLLGFCLRPGCGAPLDDWRIREAWKLFPQGLAFPKDLQCRTEWWIFWRRVAGGLSAGQQAHFFQQAASWVLGGARKKGKGAASSRVHGHEDMEVWMCLGNFERLDVKIKIELGRVLLEKMEKGRVRTKDLWTLGRLGGRIPFYGPLDRVIPAREASDWIRRILSCQLKPSDVLARALVQIGRRTGDRERDLPDEDRERIRAALESAPHAERHLEILLNPEAVLEEGEREWVFGEGLPPGLILSGQEGASESSADS